MTDVSRCSQRFQEMVKLLDEADDLSPEECIHIREHIAECPSCYRLLVTEERIRVIVRRSCVVTAPTRLREQIRLQIFSGRS